MLKEKNNTTGVIRSRKSNDRQYNGQEKRDNTKSNDPQNSTQKTKDRATQTPHNW